MHRPKRRHVAMVLVFDPRGAVEVFEDEMRHALTGAGAQIGDGGEAGIKAHEDLLGCLKVLRNGFQRSFSSS